MRFYCLACEALARLLYGAATNSAHTVDIKLISLGKHADPKQLNVIIQSAIDQLDVANYEAILVGYGLCGNWLTSLSTRSIPVVLPKVHDCIPLVLGNSDLYRNKMEEKPGTYWYTRDFIERADAGDSFIPLGASTPKIFGSTLEELTEKFGEENACYLSQIANDWQKSYQRAVWVEPLTTGITEQEMQARREAESRGWQFEKIRENPVLIRALLNGDWLTENPQHFFVIPPNKKVSLSYDENIFQLIPNEGT